MMTEILAVLQFAGGLAIGAILSWMLLKGRTAAAVAMTRDELSSQVADQMSQLAGMSARLESAQQQAERLGEQLALRDGELSEVQRQCRAVAEERTRLETSLVHQRRQAEEKLNLLEDARKQLGDAFSALASDALSKNNESFLQLAKAKLEKFQETAKGDLEKRQTSIDELLKPVRDSLKQVDSKLGEVEKSRIEAYSKLSHEVKTLSETQQHLRTETGRLVKALRRPEVRGRWGEIQLRRVVELAGMVEHCDFCEQVHLAGSQENAIRPDLVVRLPGAKSIVVDSKAPLTAYLDAIEQDEQSDDGSEQHARLKRHAEHVRGHIRELSKKAYHEQIDPSPEFVVLFLPIEACLSAALRIDPQLIEFGAERNVIVATPTTLISLLRAVHYGWRHEQLAANAKQISDLGRELYKRLGTLGEHVRKLGKNLNSAATSYNKMVGSLEHNVLVHARRFDDLGAAAAGAEVPSLQPLDGAIRVVSAPELLAVTEESPAPTSRSAPSEGSNITRRIEAPH